MDELVLMFDARCILCRSPLKCTQAASHKGDYIAIIDVPLCSVCMDKAKDEGYQKGYDQAHEEFCAAEE